MDPGILLMAILFLSIFMYAYIVYKERDDIKIPEALIVGGALLIAAYAIITNLFI